MISSASTKLRAMSVALSLSFTFTLILSWLLNRDFDVTRDFDGTTYVWRSISGFDLIAVVMILALAMFHYWRFRDGEPAT